MSENEFRFMNSRHWPKRLDKQQLCWLLNCELHDLPALMRAKLVVPLGKPEKNGKKFFETADILERATDRKWLIRMTEAIRETWHGRNGADCEEESEKEDSSKLAA